MCGQAGEGQAEIGSRGRKGFTNVGGNYALIIVIYFEDQGLYIKAFVLRTNLLTLD